MEGIARYIYETTRRMVEAHPEVTFHFLFDRAYDNQFVFGDNVIPHVIGPQSRHPILWYLWFEYAVRRKLNEIDADVFLSGDMYLSLRSEVPTVMVSHDLNYEHYPQFLNWTARNYMRHYSPKYHSHAAHLIAVSQATKEDIMDTYDISEEKISVAHNSAPDNFRPLSDNEKEEVRHKWTSGAPYFVYIGSFHPRKNIPNLLKAFDEFRSKHQGYKLVLFGRIAFRTKSIFETLDSMKYKQDVIFIDGLSYPVEKIMGAAEALCYVSLFEGFGIPILEAFCAEVPVITSTTSSMPEVAGDAALLVNPRDPKATATAMSQILDRNLADKLVGMGRIQKEKFSWDESAKIIYERLLMLT